MSGDNAKLNEKQKRFAEEYLIDLNATQAAIRAGYSERTAEQQGYQLLQKTSVMEAVRDAQEARSKRTEITQDKVLQELAKVAFSDLRKVLTTGGALIDAQDWEDDVAGFVSSVEVVKKPSGEYDEDGNPIIDHVHKIRAWDKMAALEKLGKHLGMFVDRSKVEHSGPNGGPIQTETGSSKLATFLDALADRTSE
ncbi:terminase small subunit [Phaeobacter piscinae]|uniref:terminase small subunit n=1 Tax=Phaeobacter piscinae TaxID=1580596 RepID=UPI000C99E9A0|nr:terminase small subunit [Phaeobacter piscinae]AUQ74767.1 Terminase small subunit [Phaeobacter piscinae]